MIAIACLSFNCASLEVRDSLGLEAKSEFRFSTFHLEEPAPQAYGQNQLYFNLPNITIPQMIRLVEVLDGKGSGLEASFFLFSTFSFLRFSISCPILWQEEQYDRQLTYLTSCQKPSGAYQSIYDQKWSSSNLPRQ